LASSTAAVCHRPAYILVAIVIAPPFIQAGANLCDAFLCFLHRGVRRG
jgi:hypothetical protein